MDMKFQRIEDKLDTVVERIHFIDKTLDKNTLSLEEHVKRTNLLEKKLEPIDKHVTMVNGVLKFIGLVSLIVGTVMGIKSFFH